MQRPSGGLLAAAVAMLCSGCVSTWYDHRYIDCERFNSIDVEADSIEMDFAFGLEWWLEGDEPTGFAPDCRVVLRSDTPVQSVSPLTIRTADLQLDFETNQQRAPDMTATWSDNARLATRLVDMESDGPGTLTYDDGHVDLACTNCYAFVSPTVESGPMSGGVNIDADIVEGMNGDGEFTIQVGPDTPVTVSADTQHVSYEAYWLDDQGDPTRLPLGNIDIETVSGDVELILQTESDFGVNFDLVSETGTVTISPELSLTDYEFSPILVRVRTVSGDIEIKHQ